MGNHATVDWTWGPWHPRWPLGKFRAGDILPHGYSWNEGGNGGIRIHGGRMHSGAIVFKGFSEGSVKVHVDEGSYCAEIPAFVIEAVVNS